jgi:cellulase/cellobiase CelA1
MKLFTRQGRTSFLVSLVISFSLILLLLLLAVSPQKALAASTTQQSSASESCIQITYTIASQWAGGFVVIVTITNLCSTPVVTCWNLQFDFTAGQQITEGWNATISQSGSHVMVTSCIEIPPGGSVSFGFAGIWSGSNPPPIHLIFNGVPV